MTKQPSGLYRAILIALVILVVLGGAAVVIIGPHKIIGWVWPQSPAKAPERDDSETAVELVRNKEGKAVSPPVLRLSPRAANSMGITPSTIVQAAVPSRPRALPPQTGTLAYDSEHLYGLRSRFPGEVTEVPDAPWEQRTAASLESRRPFSVGDHVRGPRRDSEGKPIPGDLLAVVWSQTLGDKKAALIDSLIDLKRDTVQLKDMERLYYDGAASKGAYLEVKRTVEKELGVRNSAERTLRMWKLSDQEIEALYKEADAIDVTKRDAKKEKEWARVEVRACCDGVIVEKNTHLGDWVDPSNFGTPMYRIADLSKLQAWIKPSEEYLPILQGHLNRPGANPLTWEIFLQSNPNSSPLKGQLVRIGASLDPNEHTPLLVGLVDNPDDKLVVGQFVTATIYVPVEKDVVEIPTTALNESRGQSVVFVQPDPDKLEFAIRAVDVMRRFKNVVHVRSRPPEREAPVAFGRFEVEPLQPGDRVVSGSVVELTNALRPLQSKMENGVSQAPQQ
jgi:membrane fusion protein, heavy metal efflux system